MRYFFILLFALSMSTTSLQAQLIKVKNPLSQLFKSKEKEKEVKVSGQFYYGEGLGEDQETAQQNALDDLKLMILEEAMQKNAELSSEDFKGYEEDVETTVFELEGRVKVLVSLPKERVNFDSSKSSNVFVLKSTESGVDVVQDETPQATPPQATPPQATPPAAEPKIITISGSSPTPAPAYPQGGSTPPSSGATPPASRSTSSSSSSYASSQGGGGYSGGSPSTSTPTQSASAPTAIDPIINQLRPIKQYEDARQILNQNKSNGKLMYGQLATLSNAQKCYFMVLNNRDVVDILDRGEGFERRSLLSGNVVDYRSVSGVVLWINIL